MDTLLDPALAETRVLFGIAEAEVAQRAQWRSSAGVFAAIDDVLREAAAHPEVFVDEQMLRGDAVELAVRAAVADLAVRLNLAEATVRAHGHIASTLRARMPSLWHWFLDGEVSTQNAREAASIVTDLPEAAWAAFDAQLVDAARALAPARFAAMARALRERLHPLPAVDRHERAVTQRRVFTEHDRDGMGWFSAYLPSETIALATARLDAAAFDLFREADENRTMSQLRADVLTDFLLGGDATAKPGIALALTIPVLTLLGHSDEPALLEGVGPIDLDTARRLAVESPSLTRLLTDPVTGAVLQLDPHQYRLTAALKRWLCVTQPTCDFPGCGRRAVNCDLDHTVARAEGGTSTAHNLAPRCRLHHTLKHQTRWKVESGPAHARPVWTSPTGYQRTTDPPPF
ncbi:MAG: HNH endonuclease [Actinobacteria bacterium]|nr:HNH endonuclease [Actinomycetota bacterium]